MKSCINEEIVIFKINFYLSFSIRLEVKNNLKKKIHLYEIGKALVKTDVEIASNKNFSLKYFLQILLLL
jgi:hypothetical protein